MPPNSPSATFSSFVLLNFRYMGSDLTIISIVDRNTTPDREKRKHNCAPTNKNRFMKRI